MTNYYPIKDRLLQLLQDRKQDVVNGISKYEHALQCATLAFDAKKGNEYTICALFHDVAGGICPDNHAAASAELLQPYISFENYRMIKYHDILQRDNWEGRPHPKYQHSGLMHFISSEEYDRIIEFVDKYDFPAFKERTMTYSIKFFRTVLDQVFRDAQQ